MAQRYEPSVELVWDGKATLGEGPVWDARSGMLLWVDIYGKRVHWLEIVSGAHRSLQLDQMIGAAVLRQSGGLMLALEHGFHALDPETGALEPWHDPEPKQPGNRFNDGKCDPAGRFFAGTMDRKEETPKGALYCLEKDGTVRKALEGVTVSNGLGWSPDGLTMYYIDSPTKRVFAFDYDPSSGELSNRRTVVIIPEGGGFPDGMAVDEEGLLWVAQWDGWQVSRWDPLTGEQVGSIPVPAARVTSVAFGGPDLDELYITTARIGLGEEDLSKQPQAGGVFRCKPGVKGLPVGFYGG
ncbi:SMP-30/gluconolactonase/LRE family protein [Paenibacillus filicis]|uniref:Regucalcin n=1 Tax=Paenibacillus gyeongsangnamensis TaxID=3388067 RepID=A0ABT4QCG8_9BACL|nr:SMP-30/gluconolactonase/LRE family protein [Paenibacillus filicis]MCZ8514520.1 SMP-30/gluconolactonase/LRE family protein [Paenibacillus filicis]